MSQTTAPVPAVTPSEPPRDAGTGRLLVSCDDRPGIVAAVAAFLRERGANIAQSDQYSTDPKGGRFFLRMVFHLGGLAETLPRLEREFAAEVAEPFDMRFQIRDAAVPKRVSILVSRYDHCLLDLLWRWRRRELHLEGVMTSVTNRLGLLAQDDHADADPRRLRARALQAAATHAEFVDRRAGALATHARLCDRPLAAEPETEATTGVR